MDVRRIKTAPGLEFDCSLAGSPDGVPVLLLHGFGVSRHFWDRQVPALADAGYFAIAPNQRGYSPGARPDPKDLDAYHIDRLVGDALDIVAAAGHGGSRFHLVGHDWGGSLSWISAARHPERLRSLSMLSRPHPASFLRALALPDGEQKRRSGHHTAFLEPDAVPKLLANNCEWLRSRHMRQGMPEAATDAHMSVLGNEAALEAALFQRPAPAAWPDQGADALHLGGCRRHGGPCGGRRDGRIHRRPVSLRGAGRRRPLCGGPGARQGQRGATGPSAATRGLKRQ